jgi:hypothetical protein
MKLESYKSTQIRPGFDGTAEDVGALSNSMVEYVLGVSIDHSSSVGRLRASGLNRYEIRSMSKSTCS